MQHIWPICDTQHIADPGSYAFHLKTAGLDIEGFLVHWRGAWYAYRNSCPHTGVSLNWMPHQFFDIESEFLQCAMHGALFEPATGLCVRGPCQGQGLRRLPVVISGTSVGLDLVQIIANAAADGA